MAEVRHWFLPLAAMSWWSCRAPETRVPGSELLGLGQSVDSAALRAIDIDAGPDGAGLPSGGGTAREGAALFAGRCAACHSLEGAPGAGPALAGLPDPGPLGRPRPLRAYWPYAPTLFDYVRRAMPPGAAGSLSPDELYALTALILYRNALWPEAMVLDSARLAGIQMPARTRFMVDSTQW